MLRVNRTQPSLQPSIISGDPVSVWLVNVTSLLSIRSMKLRHHRGPVHTVPFGEINSLTNHSRDWVIVKLEFRLPSDTDLATVKKIVKRIGQELSDDPAVAKHLLEPLKSQGVRRFEDNAMIDRNRRRRLKFFKNVTHAGKSNAKSSSG